MFVVVGLSALTLVTVIVGGFVMIGKIGTPEKPKAATTSGGEEMGFIRELGELTVTINPVQENHGLRLNLVLQMEKAENKKKEEKLKKEIEEKDPYIKDVVVTHLSSQNFKELIPIEGKQKLKETLKKKLNEILREGKVKRVYFTSFAMQ